MISEKKMELLKKLYSLAERGATDGEKAAARQQLDKLLEKYEINEADLSDEILDTFWFKCIGNAEKKLFAQVCYKINKDRSVYRRTRGHGKNTYLGVECTKAEALQIEIEYEFYKNLWSDEVSFFLEAFIQKHEIFDMSPGHQTGTISREESIRMATLAKGMSDRTLHKMIEA